ncbi:magnesium transporter [Peptoniphilaceae bacterium SGI.131]
MINEIDNELLTLLRDRKLRELRDELTSYNEADIAIFLEKIEDVEALAVFRILPKDLAAETFSFLEPETQEKIVNAMSNIELTAMVEKLYIDDVVDMLEEMPAMVVKRVMASVPTHRRDIINQYLKYPEDSAGSIMTAEYMDIKLNKTVGDAINMIRNRIKDSETVYTVYITDASRRLQGFVSVRTLLVNSDETRLEDLIEEDVIYVTTTDDREDVARLFKKYGFLSLPVVDKEKRLVGLVTIDDAVDVLEEEVTEDFEKMAGMAPSDKSYLKSSTFELARNRIGWLLFLMLSSTMTSLIIDFNEGLLVAISGLLSFVPMLTDTGGNAGSQSSTMVIRGLALGEIEIKDFRKVFFKEFGVGLLAGIGLAAANFIRVIIVRPGDYLLALTVSLSLIATVVISKIVGGLLPIAAEILKLDPAIMAAPLISTIVDSLSLLIYFFFVRSILL